MSGAPVALALLLASARVWACLRVQASWRRAIGPSWEWIAAGLGVVVGGFALLRGQLSAQLPAALAFDMAPDTLAVVVALGFELGLGTVIGLIVSLPGWALIGASEQSEGLLGLRSRSPVGGSLARALVAASLCVGLSLGLHAPLLAGLLGIFDHFALAQPSEWLAGGAAAAATTALALAATMTTLALALATPVLLTQALVQLCVVSLGRADAGAAGLVTVLGPGLRLGASLLALGAAWSAYPEAFARGM